MKIGIDCRMLGSGFGLARYTQQLVKSLQEADGENSYVLFLKQSNWNEVIEFDEFEKSEYGQVPTRQEGAIQSQQNFRKVLADIAWYGMGEQISFKKIIKQEKVDLMHFPHWNVPFFYNDPYVVTIHDLIMYHYPRPEATSLGTVKFWLKDRAHRILVRNVIKKAKHIFVTSEFTKNDLKKTLGAENEKMTVVYQAPFEYKKSKAGSNNVKKKYGIHKPFVLYVGAAYPHKNLEGLREAWKIFEDNYGDNYQLVLVGKEDYFYNRLKSTIDREQSISCVGFVSDDELATLYENAALYVFASLYEGFGLPPLEAMYHGVPVASSNRSCLPEVLGEAVLYFDPENYQQMAEVIYQGLTDEDVRSELRQQGRENLKRFSGEQFGQKIVQIYKSI